LENRVLLLRGSEGIGIDVALGCLPFEEQAIRSAVDVELEPGARVRICRPEDLLVMKAFADRGQDWLDIRGILIRQRDQPLDWAHIRKQLKPLAQAKAKPELLEQLERVRREVEGD
jgi:predicted nucleotidyltransferase